MTTQLNLEAAENVRFRELVKAMPRVTYLETSHYCDAYAAKRTSLRMFNDPDRLARAACRNRAHWQFTELKPEDEWDFSQGKTYVYCWSHLIYRGIYGNMREEAATDRWMAKHG